MIVRQIETVNLDGLHQTLDAALGKFYHGCAFGDGELRVYLSDDATTDHIMDAINIIETHDVNALTPKQQREAHLEELRERFQESPDSDHITLKELAERVIWLESEIREEFNHAG